MESIRIIHTADMHFDSPFLGLPVAKALVRKEEQRMAFAKIIDAVKTEKADVLLIAGDMFDGVHVSAQTIAFLRENFLKISDVPVLIAPGNHDCFAEDSVYDTIDFGENVHVFSSSLRELRIANACIHGYGFPSRYVSTSSLEGFRVPQDDLVHIMLLHGDMAADSTYNPISAAQIKATGADYVALGHVHTFSGIQQAGLTAYAYSGVPEGRYFDEQGVCGYICGTVSKANTDLRFVPVCKRQNTVIYVDITGCTTYDTVLRAIRDKMERQQDLYKIILEGTLEPTVAFRMDVIEKALEDECFFCKVVNAAREQEQTPEDVGYLSKLFAEKLRETDDETAALALHYGLAALEGREGP